MDQPVAVNHVHRQCCRTVALCRTPHDVVLHYRWPNRRAVKMRQVRMRVRKDKLKRIEWRKMRVKRGKTALNGNYKEHRVVSPTGNFSAVATNQLAPLRYLSNKATVRRME